jgi:hypothetical protein
LARSYSPAEMQEWAVLSSSFLSLFHVCSTASLILSVLSSVPDSPFWTDRVFTRQGHDGVRHVEVRRLLAAVFVHRDSRAGDPNLHTHVAIANKVQTLAGDWLAIDAQVLYRAKVSLSEEYTTHLQGRLTQLGLSFVATGRDGKRLGAKDWCRFGFDSPLGHRNS